MPFQATSPTQKGRSRLPVPDPPARQCLHIANIISNFFCYYTVLSHTQKKNYSSVFFCLTSCSVSGKSFFRRGAVAQLGERLNGIQEAKSSILFSSTIFSKAPDKIGAFLSIRFTMDTSSDNKILSSANINFLPYIGDQYASSHPRILVLGHSHYAKDTDVESVKE